MKIIVCDMSGIVTNRGENNVALLDFLQSLKNYQCTFCTGKGYLGAHSTLKDYNFKLPFICENGSAIVSMDGKVLYNDSIDYLTVSRIIRQISNIPFEFLACIDLSTHKYKFLRGSKPPSESLLQPWFFSDEIYTDIERFLEDVRSDSICRITTRGLELKGDEDFLNEFFVVVSENEFHSICNPGINKGNGVRQLSSILNIAMGDIVIIGNDINDIDMFRLPSCYKIATGIGVPPQELIALADAFIPLADLPMYLSRLDSIK